MTPVKTMQKWVKEAMKASDAEYQLVEVCRTIEEAAMVRCLDVAKRTGAVLASMEISKLAGLELKWGPMPRRKAGAKGKR
jgi:hypothetical protein